VINAIKELLVRQSYKV